MPVVTAGLIIGGSTLAAGVAGDVASAQGQEATNAANAQQAALNRQFQSEMQAQAEQYQTDMSNTAMQRRVSDLEKAGLNPLLAISQGGASTPGIGVPSGSQAQMQNPSAAFSQLGGQVAGAMNAATTAAQIDNINAQTKKTISETPTPQYVTTETNPDGSQTVTVNANAGHELGDQSIANAQAAISLINANLKDPGGQISVGQAQQKLNDILEQRGEVDLETAKQIQSQLIKATNANNKLDTITATSGQRVMGATAAGQQAGTWIEALRLIIGASKGH